MNDYPSNDFYKNLHINYNSWDTGTRREGSTCSHCQLMLAPLKIIFL